MLADKTFYISIKISKVRIPYIATPTFLRLHNTRTHVNHSVYSFILWHGHDRGFLPQRWKNDILNSKFTTWVRAPRKYGKIYIIICWLIVPTSLEAEVTMQKLHLKCSKRDVWDLVICIFSVVCRKPHCRGVGVPKSRLLTLHLVTDEGVNYSSSLPDACMESFYRREFRRRPGNDGRTR